MTFKTKIFYHDIHIVLFILRLMKIIIVNTIYDITLHPY